MSKEELLDNLTKVITDGDASVASEVAQEILAAGIDPLKAIQQGATKGLDIIGERFQRLEAYLPELIKGGQSSPICGMRMSTGKERKISRAMNSCLSHTFLTRCEIARYE